MGKILGPVLPVVFLLSAPGWAAQNSPSSPPPPIGQVAAVGAGQFTLHTDSGSSLTVLVPAKSAILLVPPGAKNLSSATKISVQEIVVGDRAMVRGSFSPDDKSITASSVIVMSKTALTERHQAEEQAWREHGIAGIVKGVDTANRQLTLAVPNNPPTPQNPTHPLTLTLAANAQILRYAPNSANFSDARPAPFGQIKIGDQIRALGTLSADGKQYTARELVSGTFRNIGATVVSVDAAKGAIQIKNLANGKLVQVQTTPATKMHTLLPFVAMMIARFNSGGAMPGPPGGTARHGAQGGNFRGPGGAGGPHPMTGGVRFAKRPGDFNQLLERMPPLALSDLKPGEPLIVVSTEGVKQSEVTALDVLAGVRPILEARPKGSKQVNLGPWNMGSAPSQSSGPGLPSGGGGGGPQR